MSMVLVPGLFSVRPASGMLFNRAVHVPAADASSNPSLLQLEPLPGRGGGGTHGILGRR